SPVVIIRHRNQLAQGSHYEILARIDFVLPHHQKPNSADDQKTPKDVKQPVKTGDQANAGTDKDAAHDQRAQHAPEQDAMLMLFGDREKIEDHQEDKKVIDAERKLQNVAGDKLQRRLM